MFLFRLFKLEVTHLPYSLQLASLNSLLQINFTMVSINSMYVRYPESKFRWAIERKRTRMYFQTIYIAISCTYLTLFFDIASTTIEALVVAGHQFLYPCIIE
jgi:hypothetical protein